MDTKLGAAAAALLFLAAPALPAQTTTDAVKHGTTGKSTLSKSDQRYFEDLARANVAEVQAAKMAQSKSTADDVKQFASHMIEDHGKLLDEQRSMGATKNIAVPGSPDKSHQDALKKLERQSGTAFDTAYAAQMVKDHEAALKLLQSISGKGTDADLKAAAQKATPEVQKHLDMAKSLASAHLSKPAAGK